MGTNGLRLTTQTLKVLAVLISSKDELSGAEIARSTKLASGTLYPILIRLEAAKWVKSRWERDDPRDLGRPRRRLYEITALGATSARREFREMSSVFGVFAWQ